MTRRVRHRRAGGIDAACLLVGSFQGRFVLTDFTRAGDSGGAFSVAIPIVRFDGAVERRVGGLLTRATELLALR